MKNSSLYLQFLVTLALLSTSRIEIVMAGKGEIPQGWTAAVAVAYAINSNPDIIVARKRIETAQTATLLATSANWS